MWRRSLTRAPPALTQGRSRVPASSSHRRSKPENVKVRRNTVPRRNCRETTRQNNNNGTNGGNCKADPRSKKCPVLRLWCERQSRPSYYLKRGIEIPGLSERHAIRLFQRKCMYLLVQFKMIKIHFSLHRNNSVTKETHFICNISFPMLSSKLWHLMLAAYPSLFSPSSWTLGVPDFVQSDNVLGSQAPL